VKTEAAKLSGLTRPVRTGEQVAMTASCHRRPKFTVPANIECPANPTRPPDNKGGSLAGAASRGDKRDAPAMAQ